MKTIYLNMRTSSGVETVDEFSPEQGQNPKDFKKYVCKMVGLINYILQPVYNYTFYKISWIVY